MLFSGTVFFIDFILISIYYLCVIKPIFLILQSFIQHVLNVAKTMPCKRNLSLQALTTFPNMKFGFGESSATLEHCKKDVSGAVVCLADQCRY